MPKSTLEAVRDVQPPGYVPEPPKKPKATADADGEWFRMRRGKDHNGVEGDYLERLTVLDGEVVAETLHGPDLRPIVQAKLIHVMETTLRRG